MANEELKKTDIKEALLKAGKELDSQQFERLLARLKVKLGGVNNEEK